MSEIETCKRETEIVVPVEEVAHTTEHVVAEVQKKARIPGFRPGKVPTNIIRSRFKAEIRQDVIEHILPQAFRKRAEAEHWDVVGTPNVKEIHFEDGEPLRFKAEFEVAPQWELGEYRNIEVHYAAPQVSEEDIDARVEDLRNRKAEFVNEEPRPLQDGDYALISIESVAGVDGDPVKSENMSIHLGDPETMPEFNEHLRDMSPGETKEIDVTYPAEYGHERLAGKTVRFHVELKSVRRKELPEVNDEFAQDLGDYKNLEELRDAIRASIRAEREYAAQQAAKNEAVDKLVETHTFPVPEAFVDRQIENQIERQLRELAMQGIDPRQLKLDWEKLKEARREAAIKDVRASLILERVAERESVYATNDEVDRELQQIAKREREPVAALRMRFEKDGTLGRIAGRIRTEKVLNFLFENARKVAPEAQPAAEETAE